MARIVNHPFFSGRLWKLLCSLKLAIVLASAATLLIVGGSLVMHYNPRVFGDLDRVVLGEWLRTTGTGHPGLTWWLFPAGICILLLGVNTLCCTVDWLRNVRTRWRKTGEYLIHTGFVLIVMAYAWGSLAGYRSPDNRLLVGEELELPSPAGATLYLEDFEPVFNDQGRPVDMRSTVELRKNGKPVARQVVRTNTPLLHEGLVVVPGSFGRVVEGFHFLFPGMGEVLLKPGETLRFGKNKLLRVLEFHPHARRSADGRVHRIGDRLGSPAIELELLRTDGEPWRGWYFLREGLPFPLVQSGLRPWPTEPVYRFYSILTVNRDPGAGMALVGALAMLVGVCFAMASFYYKRARGDRPEV